MGETIIISKGDGYIAAAKINEKEIRSEFADIVEAAKWVKSVESEVKESEKNIIDYSDNCAGDSCCRE